MSLLHAFTYKCKYILPLCQCFDADQDPHPTFHFDADADPDPDPDPISDFTQVS